MPPNNSRVLHGKAKQLENPRTPISPYPTAIVCRMGDNLFFDDKSLLMQSEAPSSRPRTTKPLMSQSSGTPMLPPVQPAQPWSMPPSQPAPRPPAQRSPRPNPDLNVPSGDANLVFKPYPISVLKPVFAINLPMFINSSSSSSLFKNTNDAPQTAPNPFLSMGHFHGNPNNYPILIKYQSISPLAVVSGTPASPFQPKRESADCYPDIKDSEIAIISSEEEEDEKKHKDFDLNPRL